jgi:hemerythrin-like domain-containing protein
MQKAVGIIYNEHRSISAILSGLKSLAELCNDPAVRPEFPVLHAMIYYIDAFPERQHHPKEDGYLFERVAARDPGSRELIDALKAEHVVGARMVRDLERALNEFELTWPKGAERFSAAVDAYAQFHWNHMRREEHDLIPRAEAALTAGDWAEINDAFAANNEPIGDLRNTDFNALYQRILHLAPAPIGLGERWKREHTVKQRRTRS